MVDPKARDKEREEAQIRALHDRVERKLAQFRTLAAERPPEQLDAFSRPLIELLQDKRVDGAVVRRVRDELKAIELEANMRASDTALRLALGCAKADLKAERAVAIQAARGYLRRADVLGASEDFKRAAQMALEAALLTGGIKQKGPTRAKPLDLTPRPPNRAKSFEVETVD